MGRDKIRLIRDFTKSGVAGAVQVEYRLTRSF
jgi:hypothetical protein